MKQILLLLTLLSVNLAAAPSPPLLLHDLRVRLLPAESRLEVQDRISLPAPVTQFQFLLHDGLAPELAGSGGRLIPGRRYSDAPPVRRYRVQFDQPTDQFQLDYAGQINQPLQPPGSGGSRGGSSGLITADGVFLAGSSYWYPHRDSELISFRMRVGLPDGWRSVSQGKALAEGDGWQELQPQDEIYLLAAPFHHYSSRNAVAEAEVYLRRDDPALAERYLQVTGDYLRLYSDLIGPYPYAKFALVENFWESGYGMPSFTLLGPRVIRLPFILYSSYPHEILHNWWGNSVYIDYREGNWAEGLTSYLADHLIKEQQGAGAAYRRDTLQRYADYVADSKDFPLSEFRANHGDVSQAVGYGKTLMLLHMLRRQLGDRQFIQGLRRFYRDNRFRQASFSDLRRAFEGQRKDSLAGMFTQWTKRSGAPSLQLADARVTAHGEGFQLQGTLLQTQPEAPFSVTVPLYVQLEGQPQATRRQVMIDGRRQAFSLRFDRRPLRIAVDPRFELFRRLDASEIPSSLAQLFAAEQLTIVLPADSEKALYQGYQAVARQWAARQPGTRIVKDSELQALPERGAVWLFGLQNRLLPRLIGQLDSTQATLSPSGIEIADREHATTGYSAVLTARSDSRTIGLLTTDRVQALPGLARKLPHYGKYSYLIFTGTQPAIQLRGQWQSSSPRLTRTFADTPSPPPLRLPAEVPLIPRRN